MAAMRSRMSRAPASVALTGRSPCEAASGTGRPRVPGQLVSLTGVRVCGRVGHSLSATAHGGAPALMTLSQHMHHLDSGRRVRLCANRKRHWPLLSRLAQTLEQHGRPCPHGSGAPRVRTASRYPGRCSSRRPTGLQPLGVPRYTVIRHGKARSAGCPSSLVTAAVRVECVGDGVGEFFRLRRLECGSGYSQEGGSGQPVRLTGS